MIPLLDLKTQYAPLKAEIQAVMNRVCDSQYFILGPDVEAFEQDLATYCQAQFALGVSSGTDALLLALMALDIGPGDEVITTPYTFFATAGCVARVGAKAVFVDIDPQSYNLDPRQIEAAITSQTRAIMPVHLYGQCADMEAIMAVAERHNLPVIEDAAQAIGAEYKGQRAGNIGHIGCFSFFPSKNLGAFGDAGAVTTNDPELAKKMKFMRMHGEHTRYYHQYIGGNFRIDALQAAILSVKLRYLDEWTAGRQRNAADYNALFRQTGLTEGDNPMITLPHESLETGQYAVRTEAEVNPFSGHRHIYNQYVLRFHEKRDELKAYLQEHQIGHAIYYPVSLHEQECFAAWGGKTGQYPHSELAAKQTLAIPIYPELTMAQKEEVVQTIARFYQ